MRTYASTVNLKIRKSSWLDNNNGIIETLRFIQAAADVVSANKLD